MSACAENRSRKLEHAARLAATRRATRLTERRIGTPVKEIELLRTNALRSRLELSHHRTLCATRAPGQERSVLLPTAPVAERVEQCAAPRRPTGRRPGQWSVRRVGAPSQDGKSGALPRPGPARSAIRGQRP